MITNSSAKSTLILLDNLLNWAKSQTDQLMFRPANFNFSDVVGEIIKLKTTQAKAKGISLNYISLDEMVVFADENMLKVILRNLVSNAIKFTEYGGQVNISANRKQDCVEISVSDTGIGMSKKKIKELFNISLHSTNRGTANEHGSGLGLMLCKEFVDKHKGKIWVESQVGKGSDFRFTLPLKNA